MTKAKIKEIDPQKWYSLKHIADKNWIVNTTGKGDRFHLHRLIRSNRLVARDFGVSRKILRVQGDSIINFIKRAYL